MYAQKDQNKLNKEKSDNLNLFEDISGNTQKDKQIKQLSDLTTKSGKYKIYAQGEKSAKSL